MLYSVVRNYSEFGKMTARTKQKTHDKIDRTEVWIVDL